MAILRGDGRAFCAGADFAAVAAVDGEALGDATESFAGFVSMERSTPVIAAVHGYALAGGLELALACAVVIAAGMQLGLPEVTRGLVAAAGGAIRLPRLIPERRGLELAEAIAANAPAAVRESLRLVRATRGLPETQAWEHSASAWRSVAQTADAREGAAAFLERRAPRWSGA